MRRAALVGIAALLLAGCARGRLVRGDQVDQDGLAAVERSIVAIRGRALRERVPAVVLDPAGLRAMIASDVDASFAPGDVERVEAVYTALGLLPPNTSLRAAIERLYEAEGAAFYDPRGKRLVISTKPFATPFALRMVGFLAGRDLAGEMVVAHELVHAIQDQNWGVPTDPDPIADAHGDCGLAHRALLEGDATLAGFAQVLGGGPDAKAVGAIERELAKLPAELAARYPDVPPALLATLGVQYHDGVTFVGRALRDGGWRAVDAVHEDPPTSTEQILHPERYFDIRDAPVAIALGGTEILTDWTPVVQDTFGEIFVRVIAERKLPAERAAAVAAGWGGDRLRALARGGEMVLVWMTTWDTPADADEWDEAIRVLLPDAHVARHDLRVLAVLAPPGVDATATAATVMDRTRFTRGITCRPPPGGSAGPRRRASGRGG